MQPPSPLTVALALALGFAGACRGTVEKPGRDAVDDDDDAGTRTPTGRDAGGTVSSRDAGHDATRGDAGRSDGGAPPSPSDAGSAPTPTGMWRPAPGTSWQWQLSGNLDTSVDVAMYDIDLFGTSASQIASLHAAGRKVVCYFDTAYEPYRPDEGRLRPYRGNTIDGWPDQNWLDVRKPEVVEVMKERLDLAAEKKCDGVEADDVDVANNDTGFDISREQQRTFIRTLAREAHARGLSYGLKNALEDVQALVGDVDFAVNEQCFEYDECALLSPLVRAGKAVFNVEYPRGSETLERRGRDFCTQANALNFDSLAKQLELGAERYACR
ncbi:MAG: endo alpha-1,4 polygalactosaminidase [Polyangiales bacterium]